MSELDVFMETCSVGVHPDTVALIVEHVGPPNLNLLRILTAGGDVVTAAVENQRDGINKTIRELEKGSVVSVGVMQVSSDYWLEYDVNVFDMWEPCTNITVGTTIFANEYVSVLERTGNETEAMKHSLKQYLESNLFINDADTVIGDMFGNIQYTQKHQKNQNNNCLLYTSPSPRDS